VVVLLVIFSLVVPNISSINALVAAESVNNSANQENIKSPATAFRTASYFSEQLPSEMKAGIELVSDRPDTLSIKIGYKSSSGHLMLAKKPTKELTLWRGKDLYPFESESFTPIDGIKERIEHEGKIITKEWDLIDIGFKKTDYLNSNKRIWYLKIERIPGKPGGIYADGPEGTLRIDSPDDPASIRNYQPFLNCLLSFEMTFGGLTFKTMFHPIFDGSKPVIIPIQGTNHELINQQGKKEGISTGSFGTRSSQRNVLALFANCYSTDPDKISPSTDDYASCFMMGDFGDYPDGMVDYGWEAFYVMDGDTEFATVDITYPQFYRFMMLTVDSYVGNGDQVLNIIFAHGGQDADGTGYFVMTGISDGRSGAICENYLTDAIRDIGNDGSWLAAFYWTCHSSNLPQNQWNPGWSSEVHQNHLCIYGIEWFSSAGPGSYNDETLTFYMQVEAFFYAVSHSYSLKHTCNYVIDSHPGSKDYVANFMGTYWEQYDLNL
jgi:hypothetical protein